MHGTKMADYAALIRPTQLPVLQIVVGSRHAMDRVYLLDHAADVGGGAGLAEIEALHGGAAGLADELELLGGLDAFRRGLGPEIGAKTGDSADDRGPLMGQAERSDEGAVDLDHVEREFPQVPERGIADAEIVQADAHAKLAQLMQDGAC